MRLALVMALLLSVPAATAFSSLPPGKSPHDQVTAAAAGPLGFTPTGLKALQTAVRGPDVAETKVKANGNHIVAIDAAADYEPSHHCDRLPPVTDAQVFAATARYVQLEKEVALQFARSQHAERAIATLGRALHALQDCHSHSDIVDHDAETQEKFQDALAHGLKGDAPDGVRFTGFQPGAKDAQYPLGDGYPHGDYAKDDVNTTKDAAVNMTDGRNKYEAARDLAIGTTRMFLTDFLAQLDATQRQDLFDAKPETVVDKSPIPALEFPMMVLALVASGGLLRAAKSRYK